MANAYSTATVTCNVAASPGTQVFSATLPTADQYVIQGTLQLPNVVPSASQGSGAGAGTGTGGGAQVNSSVVTVVKQNSSTIFTSNAGARGFSTAVTASAGDVITINLYSSTAQDQQLNSCQATISIYEGEAL